MANRSSLLKKLSTSIHNSNSRIAAAWSSASKNKIANSGSPQIAEAMIPVNACTNCKEGEFIEAFVDNDMRYRCIHLLDDKREGYLESKRTFPRENCKFKNLVERTPGAIPKRSTTDHVSNEDSNSEDELDRGLQGNQNKDFPDELDHSEPEVNDELLQTTDQALAFVRDLQNKVRYLNNTIESYRKINAENERGQLANINKGKKKLVEDQKEIDKLSILLTDSNIQLEDMKKKLTDAEAEMKILTAKLHCEKSKVKSLEERCVLNEQNPLKKRASLTGEEVIRVIGTTEAQFDPIDYLKEIATFSGKINSSLSFEEWIGRFDNVATCAGWSDVKKCRVLSSKLSGSAFDYMKNLERANPADVKTYDRFKEKLRERFDDLMTPETYFNAFNSAIREAGESIQDFAQRVEKLHHKAVGKESNNLDILQLKLIFIGGLEPELAKTIRSKDPKTFREAVSIAIKEQQYIDLYKQKTESVKLKAVKESTRDDAVAMMLTHRGSRTIKGAAVDICSI